MISGQQQVLPTDSHSIRSISLTFVIFLGVAFFIHFWGLNSPMIYDSKSFIEDNSYIYARHNPVEVLHIIPSRPLFMMSLYLNYLAAGMDPYFYRIVNVMILSLTALVLVYLSRLVFETPVTASIGSRHNKQIVSVFIGLLFLVHPLQSLVVLYVWQREAILACLLYFSSVAAYVATRTGRVEKPLMGYVLTGITFLAGLLSKENVITLPLVLVLAEFTLFGLNMRHQFLRKIVIIVLITAPAILIFVIISHYLHEHTSIVPHGFLERLGKQYARSGWDVTDVLLTECRLVFRYLLSIIAPFLYGTEFLRATTVSRSLWNPPATVVACAGVFALIGVAFASIRRAPLLSFGILWFFLTLTPESTLIPQYLFFGYRAILPMAGLLITLGFVALLFIHWMSQKSLWNAIRLVMLVGLGALVLSFGLVTTFQARNWNPILIWKKAYEQLPIYTVDVEKVPYLDIVISYSNELMNAGKLREAVKVLQNAAEIDFDMSSNVKNGKSVDPVRSGRLWSSQFTDPDPVQPSIKTQILINLGDAFQRSGDIKEALRHYELSLQSTPCFSHSYVKKGLAFEEVGQSARAIAQYRNALECNPKNKIAHNNLGLLLEQIGQPKEAIQHYRQSMVIDPAYTPAYINLGLALRKAGERSTAIDLFRKAISIDPTNGAAYSNLGVTLEEMGQLQDAIVYHRKAVELFPESADAHYAMANALLKSGDSANAIISYRKALHNRPGFSEAWYNMGLALLMNNQIRDAACALKQAAKHIKDNPDLYFMLGQAYKRLGAKKEAMHSFETALKILPSHSGALTELQHLREK